MQIFNPTTAPSVPCFRPLHAIADTLATSVIRGLAGQLPASRPSASTPSWSDRIVQSHRLGVNAAVVASAGVDLAFGYGGGLASEWGLANAAGHLSSRSVAALFTKPGTNRANLTKALLVGWSVPCAASAAIGAAVKPFAAAIAYAVGLVSNFAFSGMTTVFARTHKTDAVRKDDNTGGFAAESENTVAMLNRNGADQETSISPKAPEPLNEVAEVSSASESRVNHAAESLAAVELGPVIGQISPSILSRTTSTDSKDSDTGSFYTAAPAEEKSNPLESI